MGLRCRYLSVALPVWFTRLGFSKLSFLQIVVIRNSIRYKPFISNIAAREWGHLADVSKTMLKQHTGLFHRSTVKYIIPKLFSVLELVDPYVSAGVKEGLTGLWRLTVCLVEISDEDIVIRIIEQLFIKCFENFDLKFFSKVFLQDDAFPWGASKLALIEWGRVKRASRFHFCLPCGQQHCGVWRAGGKSSFDQFTIDPRARSCWKADGILMRL